MIILTRAKEDCDELAQKLQASAKQVFILPCIEFTAPKEGYAQLDYSLRNNHEYDWVFFLSKRSVEAFFNRLLEINGHLFNLSPRLRIACIGDSTRSVVENEIGMPVDFSPSQFNSECFAKEFIEKYAIQSSKAFFKILIPRTKVEDETLVSTLLDHSLHPQCLIEIDTVAAYSSNCPDLKSEKQQKLIQEFKALVQSKNPTESLELYFTSSQIVRNFKSMLPDIDLTAKNIQIHSIGPKTSKTIKELYHPQINILEAKHSDLSNLLAI